MRDGGFRGTRGFGLERRGVGNVNQRLRARDAGSATHQKGPGIRHTKSETVMKKYNICVQDIVRGEGGDAGDLEGD